MTHQRCSIITKGKFENWAPTFLKVDKPERLKCELQQAVVFADDEFNVVQGAGWFGAYSLEEARIAKLASDGDLGAMFQVAQLRSFRFLRSADALPHVERWIDIDAAGLWFSRAAQSGFIPAALSESYLKDLIEFGERAYPRQEKRDFIETTIAKVIELESDLTKVKSTADEDLFEWEIVDAFQWFNYSFDEWKDRNNVVSLALHVKALVTKWENEL